MRNLFVGTFFALVAMTALASYFSLHVLWAWVLLGPLFLMGFSDYFQKSQAVKRNFPLLGRFRYLFEMIRPEIQQYFIEDNTDGRPFTREDRSLVYQRAKKTLDTLPFGTQKDVMANNYEWINHSLSPVHVDPKMMRVLIGGDDCTQKYDASILNISAMSFGALSKNAVKALNEGAKMGGFAHNTGEGSISAYHRQGGDLIWQIGTGYFGARTKEGSFCEESFARQSKDSQVKMIEIKLSQGAKPGHGGILPKEKLTAEIAEIRHVPMGEDVLSPSAHTAFSTPLGLIEFVAKLRKLSGGKPVGFKLCVGKRREFLAICKAMVESNIYPDFITVDGSEGGTGAAPLEFSNHIGTPLKDAVVFVHNSLQGFGLRDKIKIIAAGKVITGFDLVRTIALGADLCYSARGMMLSLGCIQALRCNSNHCPVGVATQNPELVAGLDPTHKKIRVKNYHELTIESVAEILGAAGIEKTSDLRPWNIMCRLGTNDIKHYGEIFDYIGKNSLLEEPLPPRYARALKAACPNSFKHAVDL